MSDSFGTQWLDCTNQPIDMETALKALFVYNEASGKYAVNLELLTANDGTTWISAATCATEVSLLTMLLGSITIDGAGNPALRMVHNTYAP